MQTEQCFAISQVASTQECAIGSPSVCLHTVHVRGAVQDASVHSWEQWSGLFELFGALFGVLLHDEQHSNNRQMKNKISFFNLYTPLTIG
jgi:hypothetical protein